MPSTDETSYSSHPATSADITEQLRLDLPSPTYLYYKVSREGCYYFMKALRPELLGKEYYRETLRKEYELGHTLQDGHIVRYHEIVDTPTECHVLMDYVNGHTLAEFVELYPDYFSNKEHVRRFLCQLLQALREMHTHQALHLDLKPSNIMLTSVNNDVRLIDLGCSYTDARPSTTGHTDRYAAPEQLTESGNFDARTDIYAVGCILSEIGHAHYHKIAQHCMARQPDERYVSVDEVLSMLNKSHRRFWSLVLLTTLMLVALAIWQYGYGGMWPGMQFADARDQDSLFLHAIRHSSAQGLPFLQRRHGAARLGQLSWANFSHHGNRSSCLYRM